MGQLLALLLVITAGCASAQSISYELFEVSGGVKGKVLAHGTKTYSVDEIQVSENVLGPKFWSKEILVTGRYAIGGHITRETQLVGFGLWLRKRPEWYELWSDGGFSWDWFNRRGDNVFLKLQGGGSVKAVIRKGLDFEELIAVEFLDDVTLRLNAKPWFFFSHADTHHMVIRKGSVLKFAP